MENTEKDLLIEIKKLRNELRKLDSSTRKLEAIIEESKRDIASVKKFEKSDNPRDKMIYLEAVRRWVCLKNDLTNTNLMITFKLDELEALQNKLKLLSQAEPTL